MTADELIEEGRRLARPCVYLRDVGDGPAAAHWYPKDDAAWDAAETSGGMLWLTVDLSRVPGLSLPPDAARYLSVYTNEKDGDTGRVELASEWPAPAPPNAVPLFATDAAPLPPVDAVFTRGSDAVRDWLRQNNWPPDEPYNANFKDYAVADAYDRAYQTEFPLFQESDVYAILGGWHTPWPEGDWHDLLDQTLVVWTFADSEPWVEVWRDRDGSYSVIQRIT